MSLIKTVEHPTGKLITFFEDDHEYRDDTNKKYLSTTTLVHSLFPEFEEKKISYFIAKKRVKGKLGFTQEDILEEQKVVLKEWEEKRNSAADLGTQVHRYAECLLLDIPFDMDLTGERQKKMVKVVDKFLVKLNSLYDFIEAEKIIFSPTLLLSGTVDLIMRNKGTKKPAILDWKTNKAINLKDEYNKKGLGFLNHIDDSNYWHYTIQLNIYRWMLHNEGYGDYYQSEMGLFHVKTTEVEGYPGLIVHGPLLATMMLELLWQNLPGAQLRSFQFKALRPVFDNKACTIRATSPDSDGNVRLWVADHEGALCMQGQANIRP